jgi:hypothetical protein
MPPSEEARTGNFSLLLSPLSFPLIFSPLPLFSGGLRRPNAAAGHQRRRGDHGPLGSRGRLEPVQIGGTGCQPNEEGYSEGIG